VSEAIAPTASPGDCARCAAASRATRDVLIRTDHAFALVPRPTLRVLAQYVRHRTRSANHLVDVDQLVRLGRGKALQAVGRGSARSIAATAAIPAGRTSNELPVCDRAAPRNPTLLSANRRAAKPSTVALARSSHGRSSTTSNNRRCSAALRTHSNAALDINSRFGGRPRPYPNATSRASRCAALS
jgi:hypothetical protein